MARKFNNPSQSNKKTQEASYNSPPRNSRIQKDTKKDQPKSNHVPHKITPPTQSSQKFVPPPPPSAQTKPMTQAGKNNLAKLASINKLMGNNLPSANIKINQSISQSSLKSSVKKPSSQQVSQALQSLKDLQKLLDSYQELEMDHNSNLKTLLDFMQQKKITNQAEKEKIQV